jgi:hypothetical protein
VELAPDNQAAICLLSQAYEGMGDQTKAAEFKSKCEKSSGK